MSTNQETAENGVEEMLPREAGEAPDLELPPPVVTRTRSGRRVRPPAALLDSAVPSLLRTPSRRTRKSVIQELPGEATGHTEPDPQIPAVEHILESHKSTTTCMATDKSDGLVSDSDACNEKENEVRAVLESAPEPPNKTAKRRTHSESSEKLSSSNVIPLGKPKSGRVWKDRNKQRFSALLRDKPLRSSWEKKMEAKREKDLVKKYSLQLKEDKARKKEDKRKRHEENLKRRAENERKAEVVQVIRNTTKIKRMKKKQLRKIEKRDTLAMLQKSQSRTRKPTGEGSKGEP